MKVINYTENPLIHSAHNFVDDTSSSESEDDSSESDSSGSEDPGSSSCNTGILILFFVHHFD